MLNRGVAVPSPGGRILHISRAPCGRDFFLLPRFRLNLHLRGFYVVAHA
jgi:hypothetical protein